MIRHIEGLYHGYEVFIRSGYFFVIVEQLTQSLQGQGVSISDVDLIILLAQYIQIPKYYNEIFTELFLKN